MKDSNFPEFAKEAQRLEECFALNQKLVKEFHNRLDKHGEALDSLLERVDRIAEFLNSKKKATA